MTRLQSDLLRAKATLQTRILMQRHRVWTLDSPLYRAFLYAPDDFKRWTEAELREAWGR